MDRKLNFKDHQGCLFWDISINILRIRGFLSQNGSEKVMLAFVMSRLITAILFMVFLTKQSEQITIYLECSRTSSNQDKKIRPYT